MEIDAAYLTRTAADLVAIPSCNPSLTPGSAGEADAAAYVAAAMRDLGLDVSVHAAAPGRPNVVGVLPGTGGGRSLLLNAHLDTVGVEGMTAPFSAEIRDGKLYGRGSQDMKGSMAAMLACAKAVIDNRQPLAGDLLVTAVVDEEYVSVGMQALVDRVSADAAIVTEPTDLQVCTAHRGFNWYEIRSTGRAAHGSRYEEGVDAIMRMGRFLAQLDQLEQALRQRPAHPLVGVPSLHAALIEGGTEISIYAALCTLRVERRTNPGEAVADVTDELDAICRRLNASDPTHAFSAELLVSRPPFEIAPHRPIVQAVDAALAARLGDAGAHQGATFWTDAAILAAAGIDTVLLGPVGYGLHSAEEWVDLRSLVDLAAVMADTALTFCGPG